MCVRPCVCMCVLGGLRCATPLCVYCVRVGTDVPTHDGVEHLTPAPLRTPRPHPSPPHPSLLNPPPPARPAFARAGAVVPTHAEESLLTVIYAPHQPSLTLTLLPDESDFVVKVSCQAGGCLTDGGLISSGMLVG